MTPQDTMRLALEWIEDAVVVLSRTSSAIQGGIGAEAEGVGGCSVSVVKALRSALAQQGEQQPELSTASKSEQLLASQDHALRAEFQRMKAALAQQGEQQPVAWLTDSEWGSDLSFEKPDLGKAEFKNPPKITPLYTAAPAAQPIMETYIKDHKTPLSDDAQDAKRYRWLRDTQNSDFRDCGENMEKIGTIDCIMVVDAVGQSSAPHPHELDALIDAAMEKHNG